MTLYIMEKPIYDSYKPENSLQKSLSLINNNTEIINNVTNFYYISDETFLNFENKKIFVKKINKPIIFLANNDC